MGRNATDLRGSLISLYGGRVAEVWDTSDREPVLKGGMAVPDLTKYTIFRAVIICFLWLKHDNHKSELFFYILS
jgi:hypothetical protein